MLLTWWWWVMSKFLLRICCFSRSTILAIVDLFIHSITSLIFDVHFATEVTVYTLWAPRLSVCAKQPTLMRWRLCTSTFIFDAWSTVMTATLLFTPNSSKMPPISSASTARLFSVHGFCFKDLIHFSLSDIVCCYCNVMVLANACPAITGNCYSADIFQFWFYFLFFSCTRLELNDWPEYPCRVGCIWDLGPLSSPWKENLHLKYYTYLITVYSII